jgi:uncharacterized membrane protein
VFNVGPTELGIVLVIALIVIGLAFAGLKLLSGPSRPVTPSPDPRALLADRLARGEITRDEFDTAMRALGYPAPG